jgi:hypothetical protein
MLVKPQKTPVKASKPRRASPNPNARLWLLDQTLLPNGCSWIVNAIGLFCDLVVSNFDKYYLHSKA